jgi:glycosyltransferase involved in cell wall biosynthesis
MKILHILATPRAEGTPRLVLDWLAEDGHVQDVFVLHSQPGDLTASLKNSANWYEERNYFTAGPRKFTAIMRGVRETCRVRKPDLVISWPTGFANWACLGARLAGVKNLLVHCGNPPQRGFREDWISRYGLWPLAALGARCICCSDYVKSQYQAIPLIPDRLFDTVWNCVRGHDVSDRAERSRSARADKNCPPTAIMVATMEHHKDHATLLNALPAIRAAIPDFRLLLAGDGSLRTELQAMADRLGAGHAVEFLGTRHDVPELLGQSDLFVFSTTRQEGLGSVLLEAMAAGLPIIATDVPACREILGNGTRGTLIPPSNSAALAEAVILTLQGSALPADLNVTREFATAFTASQMMNAYLRLAKLNQPT